MKGVVDIEIRQLKYFIAVAEELHFSNAAKRLNMAQPPLSQQIKNLEIEIGVPLLQRTKRHVELTEAGEAFLKRAYAIVNSLDFAKEEATRVHNGEYGQLIVGFTGSVTYDLLPNIICSYQERHPNVNIVLKQLTLTEQIKALHNKKIHVGILVSPIDSSFLKIEELRKETFVAVLPKTHPLANSRKKIDAENLSKYPFIVTPRKIGPAFYDATISYFHRSGFSPTISQEAHELHTIVSLVSFGMGVALLPSSIIKTINHPGIVFKELKNSFTIDISCAYHEKAATPQLDSFLTVVRDIYRDGSILQQPT
ncbi:LysR family transcriptional regulator [Alkalihalobacillus sp. BA299]|uniref:LysR family transcriptional regulator n=1 Tax=Alkalihalobacillus sp. BA299 TaxID=2815938 RepID=UPI001FFDFD29|nr:LysR family transcriptional regulator [Alkalihalobacillus sp. BA299]